MRRRIVVLGVAVLLLATVAILLLWMSRQPPRWWAMPQADSPEVRLLASRTENHFAEQAHAIRETSVVWTVEVREEQVNAWLAARLPAWIDHQRDLAWPEGLQPPQVHFEQDHFRLAVAYRTGGHDQFVEVGLVPAIVDGAFTVEVDHAALGRIPMPGDPLAYISPMLDETAAALGTDDDGLKHLLDVLSGREQFDPTLTLADDRTVRLLGIRCTPGLLVLTCTTAE